MMRKACATAILAASLAGPAWADYGPYYVDPTVASELVNYSGSDGGPNDYFRFSFAAGSSVKIDFQNYPVGTEVVPWEFFLYSSSDLGISLYDWYGTDSTNFRSFTAVSLIPLDDYTVKVYGGGSLSEDVAGNYSLTFSIDQTAPVPEPETYAMMLAGLGLLGVIGRRRKLKSAA